MITEKFFAILALFWILFSLFWMRKAYLDKQPAWYGLIMSTIIVVVAGVCAVLIKVIVK